MEREVEEAEDFLVFGFGGDVAVAGCASQSEDVLGSIGCVDRGRDEAQVIAGFGSFGPSAKVWVDVCEDEIYASLSLIFFRMPILLQLPIQLLPFRLRLLITLVHLLLNIRRRTACAGAKINKCVISEVFFPKYRLESARDERGG